MLLKQKMHRQVVALVALLALLSTAAASLPVLESAFYPGGDAGGIFPDIQGRDLDPVTDFRLDYPHDGEVLADAFKVVCGIVVNDYERFVTQYSNATLCVEMNGQVARCVPLLHSNIHFANIETGNYTVSAFIAGYDTDPSSKRKQTPVVSIAVVGREVVKPYITQLGDRLRRKHSLPADLDLLEWAHVQAGMFAGSMTRGKSSKLPFHDQSQKPLLVIGVKSALQTDFHLRQAIRQTWGSRHKLPKDIHVIFIGCRLTFEIGSGHEHQEQVKQAIRLEKHIFGDLLTEELECNDSYADLPYKVSEFMRWTLAHYYLSPAFVMIADDDIYLRVAELRKELLILREESADKRMLMGQVWNKMFVRQIKPVRDESHIYYLSDEAYPMKNFPVFPYGPHYIMSYDCARFIGKNSKRLRGLAGLDDASVALWLLAMQVHSHHIQRFKNLRDGTCSTDVLSFADLSSLAIRVIDSNLRNGNDFCADFNSALWLKPDPVKPMDIETPQLLFSSSLDSIAETNVIRITTSVNGIEFSFTPTFETQSNFAGRVCKHLDKIVEASPLFTAITCDDVTSQLLYHHRAFFITVTKRNEIDLSRIELWKHNLFLPNQNARPVFVAYSATASFSHILYKCVLAAIYASNPVLVMDLTTLTQMYGVKPDLVIKSALGMWCRGDADCDAQMPLPARSEFNPYGKTILFSGESWSMNRLDESVVLVSTVSDTPEAKHHVYIPMASASFAERLEHSPLDLLSPWETRSSANIQDETSDSLHKPRRFCSFLYSQCDWPHRQYFFDLLDSMEPVDAIGKCAGAVNKYEHIEHMKSRQQQWYLDDAVRQYYNFKFVIAFENSIAPGYVTEKIVNAFLGGAIPIYWGNSTTVTRMFNPRSFIDCGVFGTLRECAEYVMLVHGSANLYEAMRREPPVTDTKVFNEIFSWHPSVTSNWVAEAITKLVFSESAP